MELIENFHISIEQAMHYEFEFQTLLFFQPKNILGNWKSLYKLHFNCILKDDIYI